MSVTALTDLAVARDADIHAGGPRKRVIHKETGAPADTTQRYRDVLTKAIPTEVLAGYTAIIGTVIGSIKKPTKAHPHPEQLLGLRWGLYAGFLVFTLGAVALAYAAKRVRTHSRRFPLAEVAAALGAAAVWGLVMPGNPFVVKLSTQSSTIYTIILTVAGGGLVGALSGILVRPSKVGKAG
jgi:hypothetical protein